MATWELEEVWDSFRKLRDPMRGVVGAISRAVRSALCCPRKAELGSFAGAPPEDRIAHSEIVVRES